VKNNRVSFAAAFLLAGVFLYLAVRGVDWHEVGRTMQTAEGGGLAAACVFASAAILLRAVRWSVLLRQDKPLSMSLVFWATSVGYLGNHFLPARLGELMRSAAIGWGAGLSKTWVLATALTERSLDAAVLVLVSSAALLTMNDLPAWVLRAAQVTAFASTAAITAIFVLPRFEHVIQSGLARLPVPPHMSTRLGKLTGHFMRGMRVFHHVDRSLRFAALTAVVWLVDGLAAMAVSESLSLNLTLAQLLLLIAALGLASALPSTPGFVGVYQFVAVSVLRPFEISQSSSLAYIFLLQCVISGCVLFWGLLGVWQLRSVRARSSSPTTVSHGGAANVASV
jgi:glycosyltransferase 2 family protein